MKNRQFIKFKNNLEKLHKIVNDDNAWKDEKNMIEELVADRKNRYKNKARQC